jgi:lysozyme family protein
MQKLLPALASFSPDLLLISSGFDAHYDDLYHYLNEDDFHWLTQRLCETCPKVVSVMEGGYSLQPATLGNATNATNLTSDQAAAINDQYSRYAISSSLSSSLKVNSKPSSQGGIAASKGSRGGKATTTTSTTASTATTATTTASSTATAANATNATTAANTCNYSNPSTTTTTTIPAPAPAPVVTTPDGGLIKGVLAHACALSGRNDWGQD